MSQEHITNMMLAGGGGGGSVMGGAKVGSLDVDNSLWVAKLLPHGGTSFVSAPISPTNLFEAKFKSFGADNMIGAGLADEVDICGLFGGLVEAFKAGMNGPMRNGTGDQMYAMQHIDMGTSLRPTSGMPGGGGDIGLA